MIWAVRLMIALFLSVLIWPLGQWAWNHRPMSDQLLFENRCAQCHALPSLERSADWPWDTTVATMRYFHGADRVISDDEATRITDWLMQQQEMRQKKETQ